MENSKIKHSQMYRILNAETDKPATLETQRTVTARIPKSMKFEIYETQIRRRVRNQVYRATALKEEIRTPIARRSEIKGDAREEGWHSSVWRRRRGWPTKSFAVQ